MLFNSFSFAWFFVGLYVVYLLTMRRLRTQNLVLLVGSYFFYGCWDWRFLGLILASTIIDYACGSALDRRHTHDPDGAYALSAKARKVVLTVSVAANLGFLGFFKYYDFFAESAADLLAAIGLPLQPRLLNVILPVGISFYTFQTLSYTIDVYRGKLRAHRSLLEFAVFVAFFPQLVAGPIVRARDFLPQIARRRRLNAEQMYDGGYLILWGLFKKAFIADNLSALVDGVFATGAEPHGGAVLVAVYAFAVQIYCDFSGYTDMARGCGKLMGFELPLNFNLPYLATNPPEFWRRWHITLSTWLRDYLYIPLGGNRKGPHRTAVNIMLVMLLGGLWHGAAWTFVLWGAYQGFLLVVHKKWQPFGAHSALAARFPTIARCLAWTVFFHLVCFGWLIFRADSVTQIVEMLRAIATSFSISGSGITILATYALPLVLMQLAQNLKTDLRVMPRLPAPIRGLGYTMMFYALVCFGANVEQPFIYFQF